jgi:GNAT superfamily N-acetyltransferase
MKRSLPLRRLRTLELHEAAACANYCLSASDEAVALNGIEVHKRGGAIVTVAAKLDVLAYNRVVGLGIDGPVEDALIDDIVNTYRRSGAKRFFVQLAPSESNADLAHRLEERGFRHHNNWMKLQRGVDASPAVRTDLRVEKIGRDAAEAFAQVVVESFEWPERSIPWIASPVGRRGWRHYMAYDDATPVATAAMFVEGAHCWIDFAATLPAARGRGAQSALVARRIADCAEAGCKLMIVETAEPTDTHPAPSFRNMRRFGFEVAYARPNYIWDGQK